VPPSIFLQKRMVTMSKTALITGASRGIGAACAQALADDGYRVIINYNHSERAALELASQVGGTAVQADVSEAVQVRRMFEGLDIDVLVCNAGQSMFGLLTDGEDEDWQRLIDLNLGGVIRCCRAAIPGMVRRQGGRIIIVSSIWGSTGASCESVYAASKAALHGLTLSLSKELGPSGITVNCVAPGVIDTDMNAAHTPETMQDLIDSTPLGRLGKPEDVASLVRFLSSDAAAFITGQIIGVDGGFTG
jgi:3-oxoacyl-[acyl-carrier protein] reductase